MSEILLLEDNIFCRKHILEIASKINPKLDFFETSRSSEAYDHSMSNDISAFLLDIKVEDYSGIELAKQLRRIKKYQFTPIIFITAMPTREMEAFRQIHCYDYILKPYSEEDIKDVFQRILVDYISEKNIVEEKKLELKFSDFTHIIDMKDIVYAEYLNRRIVIITKEETIEYIHMPMKKFKHLLDDERFLQVHQSIIINMNFVEKIEFNSKKIKLKSIKNGVPIGRSFLKEVRGKLNDIY